MKTNNIYHVIIIYKHNGIVMLTTCVLYSASALFFNTAAMFAQLKLSN